MSLPVIRTPSVLSVDGSRRGFEWNQEQPNTYVECTTSGNVVHQRSPDDLPPDLVWMSRVPAGHAEGYVDAFRNIVAQAWAAMRGEASEYPNFADGMRGIALIEAALTSARERRPVKVGG